MKEFFVPAAWQMSLPKGVKNVAGGIILPANVSYHDITNRDLVKKYPHLKRRLLDPQLYLAELNAASCRKACTNLASYGWFPSAQEFPFDSSEENRTEWRKKVAQTIETAWIARIPTEEKAIDDCIRTCLTVQKQLGVEAFILPSPLSQDVNSSYETELDWLERGIVLADLIDSELPAYASVVISDVALRGQDPWTNPLLDVVLDQLTARQVQGAYVVPVMASEESYYFTNPNAVGGLLRLCEGLKRGGTERVIVNFTGTAGLLCLAAGADAWTTGWYRSQRRMRLSDFEVEEGRVVPAYYSHPLGGEIHMESDLDRMVKAGFLDRIADQTAASEGLLRALADGKQVASVPEWLHRFGNKTASTQHFLLACIRETESRDQLSAVDLNHLTREWLEGAYRLSSDVRTVGRFNPRTAISHQFGWQTAFERLLAQS